MTTHAQVQQEMRDAREAIKLATTVKRLMDNRDFKEVFTEHYFKNHLLEVVENLHSYESTSPEHINAIAELEGVSRTKAYLTNLITKGQCAEVDLEDTKDIPDSELN